MKKSWVFFGVAALVLGLVWVPVAGATSFTETFLGTNRDGTTVTLYEGYRAEASFNLVSAGDQLKVFDALTGGNQVGSSISPNPDATGFLANGETITSGHLKLTISSTDNDWEYVSIRATSGDGSKVFLDYTWYNLDGTPTYQDFDFDLVALGQASYLSDGKYVTVTLAGNDGNRWNGNDFSLDYVSLQVEATPTGVPEPMTLLLLGLGLLGIGGLTRKK